MGNSSSNNSSIPMPRRERNVSGNVEEMYVSFSESRLPNRSLAPHQRSHDLPGQRSSLHSSVEVARGARLYPNIPSVRHDDGGWEEMYHGQFGGLPSRRPAVPSAPPLEDPQPTGSAASFTSSRTSATSFATSRTTSSATPTATSRTTSSATATATSRTSSSATSHTTSSATATATSRTTSSATSGADRLPEACRRHGWGAGCVAANCRRLHVCHLFLAGVCKRGNDCINGHSLTTVHNQSVCNNYGLDANDSSTIEKLRRDFENHGWISDARCHDYIEICFKQFTPKKTCNETTCNRLHFCRRFVAGNCDRSVCKFGHDLHTAHNDRVLARHRAASLSDETILALLRRKYPESSQQAAAGGRRRGAAAGDRRTKATAGGGRPASGDLAEELRCPICLDLFSRATTLGCGHTFCAECLRDARDSSDRCPMCREPIVTCCRSVALDNIISNIAAKQ